MPFAHLTRKRIQEISDCFDTAGIAYDEIRSLMLEGTEFENGLSRYRVPLFQIMGDLNSMNRIPFLPDPARTVPLRFWLENGRVYFRPRPEMKVFEDALSDLSAGPATPASPPASTSAIVKGLEALSQLVQEDDFAHEAVLYYSRVFEKALREFEIIADYKLMHDGLHKLQLGWPDISATLRLESAAPSLQIPIINSSNLLRATVEELQTAFKRNFVDGSERTWLDGLGSDQEHLDQAINADDAATVETIFFDLKDRLVRALSHLNSRLKTAVTSLRLKDLIDSMTDVCDILEVVAPERATKLVEQYATGVEEMTKLDEELSKLVIQHDEWQQTDNVLRTLGAALVLNTAPGEVRSNLTEGDRLANLALILNVIRMKVIPLLAGQTSRLAETIMSNAQKLEALIEQKETDRAEQSFEGFRQQTMIFFYGLDTGLRAKCDELRRIGRKLREVNAELLASPVEI